jgi:excisionase family DNA binding protein
MGRDSDREVLTVAEVSRMLGVGKNAVYEAVNRGELPSIRLGRRIVIPRQKLSEILGPTEAPSIIGPAELAESVEQLAKETELLAHVIGRMVEDLAKLQAAVRDLEQTRRAASPSLD